MFTMIRRLCRLRSQAADPVTEEIAVVGEPPTAPVPVLLLDEAEKVWPAAQRPLRVVIARSPRARAAVAAFRAIEPNGFDWAHRFFLGDEVDQGRAFVAVWNQLHPQRPATIWDLDQVLAEVDMVGVLAGQHRAEP
jgi:hypothetical protein